MLEASPHSPPYVFFLLLSAAIFCNLGSVYWRFLRKLFEIALADSARSGILKVNPSRLGCRAVTFASRRSNLLFSSFKSTPLRVNPKDLGFRGRSSAHDARRSHPTVSRIVSERLDLGYLCSSLSSSDRSRGAATALADSRLVAVCPLNPWKTAACFPRFRIQCRMPVGLIWPWWRINPQPI